MRCAQLRLFVCVRTWQIYGLPECTAKIADEVTSSARAPGAGVQNSGVFCARSASTGVVTRYFSRCLIFVLLDQAKSTRKRILREDKLSDPFPPPLQCGVCCALRAAIDYLLPKLFRIFGCLLDTPARQNANGFAFAPAYSYLRASNNSSGMEDRLEKYLRFIREVERLKSVERTAWTTSGRRESTAEHSWRLALLAMVLCGEYPRLDRLRVLHSRWYTIWARPTTGTFRP